MTGRHPFDKLTRDFTPERRERVDARKAVAHLTPAVQPKKPLPLRDLARFRAAMSRLQRSAAELLREMRDEGL